MDNSLQDRQKEYNDKLTSMNLQELEKEAENTIFLSAYANNNPRSDYHWMTDCVYDECHLRDKANLYFKAHERISKQAR